MTLYNDSFYEIINDGSTQSAVIVVPLILEAFKGKIKTVLDVGCGQGTWAKVFENNGCSVTGFDGSYIDRNKLLIEDFCEVDLNEEFMCHPRVDLAVSFEVAEHLSPERAEGFVKNLCEASDRVVFSAAIPRQGGTGHVNEQWQSYWIELFEAQGYSVSGKLRNQIWNDDRVESWYRQNIIVAVKNDIVLKYPVLFDGTLDIFNVVHPEIWGCYRGLS